MFLLLRSRSRNKGGRPSVHVVADDGTKTRKRGRPPKKKSDNSEERRKYKTAHARIVRLRKDGSGSFLGPFNPDGVTRSSVGNPDVECTHCGAFNFAGEWIGTRSNGHFSICCQNGQVNIPGNSILKDPPKFLKEAFEGQMQKHQSFRNDVRSYNSALAFASLRVNIDKSVIGNGPYIFKVQGGVYHSIGATTDAYCKMYMIDSNEAMELRGKRPENQLLSKTLLKMLDDYIRQNNPIAKEFRKMSEYHLEECEKAKTENREVREVKIAFNKDDQKDKRRYNLPSSDEVALIYVGQDGEPNFPVDFTVAPYGGKLTILSVMSPKIDPLVYPLFHMHGENGWHPEIERNKSGRGIRSRVTIREFYSHRIANRNNNIFHLGGKLFQQFVVDVSVRDESNKLAYIRNQQAVWRSEAYDGCMDYVSATDINYGGQDEPEGRDLILPASFTGSPRNMYQNYQDAMAIVREFGKPTYFITMTANPKWPEIQSSLHVGQTAADRPDIVARVFHLKFQELMDDLTKKNVLGVPIGYTYAIEFQKRGLPHAHILLIMRASDVPRDANEIDDVISAEIPDPSKHPVLYDIISSCMLHGPCGERNINAPCMLDGKCTKNYRMPFCAQTKLGEDAFSQYRRRDNGRTIEKNVKNLGKTIFDNRDVVPYNPFLTFKYNCHINVEHCASVKSVKYLYLYITKGPDRATIDIKSGEGRDEVKEHLDARYVGPQEACWKLFGFPLSARSHSVERLAVHLPRKNFMTFRKGKLKSMDMDKAARTTLTEYFELNKEVYNGIENPDCQFVRSILYQDMPHHFTFDRTTKRWKRRINDIKVISRMYTVTIKDRERFFLRMILLNRRGVTGFNDLLKIDGIQYQTFEEAAVAMNLMSDDEESKKCMEEAVLILLPDQLRSIFAMLCSITEVGQPMVLFQKYKHEMMEDFLRKMSPNDALNQLLISLDQTLKSMRTSNRNIGLPDPEYIPETPPSFIVNPKLTRSALNSGQKKAFDVIMTSIDDHTKPRFYFINAHGGTGKTFLFSVLINVLKEMGENVVAIAFSGIAATLLEGGRTVHSMFKLPVPLLDTSVSYHKIGSKESDAIKDSPLIIWDEAPMAPALSLNCVDRFLQKLMGSDQIFGGKVLVMAGDFRQILPVVQGGGRVDIVNSCIKRTKQWRRVHQLSLTQNMRTGKDETEFADWLLKLGNGQVKTIKELTPFSIQIPNEMIVTEPIEDAIFGSTIELSSMELLHSTVILCPTNDETFEMNDRIIKKLEGESKTYKSYDEIICDKESERDLFPMEFVHGLTPSGMAPHELTLKVGAIVMVIYNLSPSNGLCNGTRLVVTSLHENFIKAKIITTSCPTGNKEVALSRMALNPTDTGLPFKLRRQQIPIRLSFAMTINKAQGQTFERVGLYLPSPVFSHGQLYVAFSRIRRASNIKVQIGEGQYQGNFKKRGWITSNIVWPEVLDDETRANAISSGEETDLYYESSDEEVPQVTKEVPRTTIEAVYDDDDVMHSGLTQDIDDLILEIEERQEYIRRITSRPSFSLPVGNYNATLSVDELNVLAGISTERMIADEIVDWYLNLLAESAPINVMAIRSTLFTLALEGGEEALEDCITRYSDEDLAHADLIVQPIVQNLHWVLCVYDRRTRVVTVYDSLNGDNKLYSDIFISFLTEYGNMEVIDTRCTVDDIVVPRQQNSYDCGVFLMIFAYALCNNISFNDLSLSLDDISLYRCKIALSLLNGQINM